MSHLRPALLSLLIAGLIGACGASGTEPTGERAQTGETERTGVSSVVDGPTARALVSEGARLVDVRTPQEFAAGAIDGATNIPVQVLDQRLGELAPESEPVVVYCRSGRRSAAAADMLIEAGFAEVYDLGAIGNW